MSLDPLPQPPEVPDYNRIAQESAARSDAELKAVEEKMAGKQRDAALPPLPEPADYTVEFDWRGESAYYREPGREVWLFCAYWGGTGSLEHIHATWQYTDGHTQPLTAEERLETLRRVMVRIKERESFPMRCHELDR